MVAQATQMERSRRGKALSALASDTQRESYLPGIRPLALIWPGSGRLAANPCSGSSSSRTGKGRSLQRAVVRVCPSICLSNRCGTAAEEPQELLEGLGFRQHESRLCQQMKMATVSPGQDVQGWLSEEAASCSATQPLCSALSGSSPSEAPGSRQSDPSRIRSRIPAHMPKLFIPSTVTKFPPEITVTPPTPTLLSPKGSISEETKQKLKNVILSSQSAANVKKETLCQPALEVQETSSQESSLESDTDEEEDYMDI